MGACLLVAALAALLPFLTNLPSFRKLYWFGDSWDLLDHFLQEGLWRWTTTVFAENFVPVFKLLWMGCIHLVDGSYLGMLTVMWMTHAVIVLLLGRLLRSLGFPAHGILLAMLMLGLAWTNIEILTWSIQWSASLAVLFFLLATPPLIRLLEGSGGHRWRDGAVFASSVSASALSHSRGVLTGVALAGLCVMFRWTGRCSARRALGWAGVALVPPVAVALTIYFLSSGNHRALGTLSPEKYRLMLQFGLYYLLLSPLAALAGIYATKAGVILLFGLLKLALVVGAVWLSRDRVRILLLTLLLLDLANAALLGVGRFHTGLEAATGSRYQYNALLVFGVVVAFLYGELVARWSTTPARRAWATVLLLALWSGLNLRQWRREMRPWVAWRGVEGRALVTDTARHGEAMPGIPFLTCEQARALAARFHLH
jgi:hypothetical protein